VNKKTKKKIKTKEHIIITCGTFDPLKMDDINYLSKCKQKGDWLIVGVHSDAWLKKMHGGLLLPYKERSKIVREIKIIDEVFNFNDSDFTVRQILKLVKFCYPDALITYVSEADMKDMPEAKITGITFETMKEE